MREKILAIYGAGGLGREVYQLAMQINGKENRWNRCIFIDDDESNKNVKNMEIYTYVQFFDLFREYDKKFIIGIGEPQLRKTLFEKAKEDGFDFATLIHPDVFIPESTKIEEGTIISANTYISCDVTIGNNVLLQPHSIVGHDVKIDNHSIISTFVSLGGACEVGKETYIGMSVPIKENTKIGNNVIIGMGSVVYNDIPNGVTALGNPARPMKKNIEKKVFK
ncbi:MAG: acetyltransferase [Eubacterium sp.]